MPRSRNGHRQPSSPPASAAMPATIDAAQRRRRPRAPIAIDALMRPRDADRVGVGDHRPCTGSVFDLAMPTPSRAQNSWNAFTTRPQARDEHGEREARPADDGRSPVAVGEPAHRQRAEHEERARRRGEEHDGAVAHAERVADVGREHAERRRLELVERREHEQHDERGDAADAQAVAQRELLVADPGEQVVGEEHLLLRRRLLRLALGLGVEHRDREVGGLARSLVLLPRTRSPRSRRRTKVTLL